MTAKKKLGEKGEELAADYLESKGYEILERNFRFQRAEIDLIAKKHDVVSFIEVKTRKGFGELHPEEAVDWKKEKMMVLGAEGYLEKSGWAGDIRYDIVSVQWQEMSHIITHIEDAFWPID